MPKLKNGFIPLCTILHLGYPLEYRNEPFQKEELGKLFDGDLVDSIAPLGLLCKRPDRAVRESCSPDAVVQTYHREAAMACYSSRATSSDMWHIIKVVPCECAFVRWLLPLGIDSIFCP